jgi:hypothetical protein
MRSSTASRVRAVRWRTNSTPSLTKLALDLPSRRARRSSYRSCSSVNRMWTRVNGHALLCIRKFEGGSESRPPVARFSPTVGHGDDLDFVLAHSVHQGEGKSREDISTSAASMAWPCARIVGNGVDGVPELLAKTVRRGSVTSGVPVICGFRLLRCGRVEPDGGRSHSAPVQPRSKFFPGNRLDRA